MISLNSEENLISAVQATVKQIAAEISLDMLDFFQLVSLDLLEDILAYYKFYN